MTESSAPSVQAEAAVDRHADQRVRDAIDRLAQFEGPIEQFLQHLLAVQCHMTASDGAAILQRRGQGEPEVVVSHPRGRSAKGENGASQNGGPKWLGRARPVIDAAFNDDQPRHRALPSGDELYGQAPAEQVLAVPIHRDGQQWAVGAYLVRTRDAAVLRSCLERVELTLKLVQLQDMRQGLAQRGRDLERAQGALELVSTINACDRRAEAFMAFCNEVASRWKMDRVSLGFLEGRYVKLRGLSHTEKVVRKTKVVQGLESVMEECFDQDTEVAHPSPPEAPFVSRAAAEFSRSYGVGAVCSFPLRHDGEPVAVMTVEREQELSAEEIETLRLVSELATAHLLDVHQHDRWIGYRIAASMRHGLSKAVGPEYTWVKAAVIGVAAFLAFMVFGQGTYTVEAPFKVEAGERRVVPAPFEGFIDEIRVEPGDHVEAGAVLGTMDRSELRLELEATRAEYEQYAKEADLALREQRTTEAQIARARADGEQARIDLIEHRLEQMVLRAPMSGYVLEAVRPRHEGSRVEKGNVMFKVAPTGKLQADLFVRERDIGPLVERFREGPDQSAPRGADGTMAATSFPGDYLPFSVERISPVAEVREQRNVFRVRIELLEERPWLRPGMEGLAKVEVDQRSYAWIWTHQLIDWIRMRLWV